VFTTREALAAPFDAQRNRFELTQLAREDAVKLVERALNQDAEGAGAAADAEREAIEQLVEAVHGHARTLGLLVPALRSRGVEKTRASLVELMEEMDRKFPGSREKSLFASVELSLRRLSPANRERVRVLGVFYGVVDLLVLREITHWEDVDIASLTRELIETGLATPDPYEHVTLHPALCPYLRGKTDASVDRALTLHWGNAMREYIGYLRMLRSENIKQAEIGVTLTVLEMPNFFALLKQVECSGDAEATMDLAISLLGLLENVGTPRILQRVRQVCDSAAQAPRETWNHRSFEARLTTIQDQLANSRLREALEGAQQLLQRARQAGEHLYAVADYDLASACHLLARVFEMTMAYDLALPLLDEAQKRFENFERKSPGQGAERMALICTSERGDCLYNLGRLDHAAATYAECIRRNEKAGNARAVAVGKCQLAKVCERQGRGAEALQALEEGREVFRRLKEERMVAATWHQIGNVYFGEKQREAAEDAYRKALQISVHVGNATVGDATLQANALTQLGHLYGDLLGRFEEAVTFYRQAADRYSEIGNAGNEGRARRNLAKSLRIIGHLDEARRECRAAITCCAPFGHATQPWLAWDELFEIESDAGNASAAAEAKRQAISLCVAYRRDGGEFEYPSMISLDVIQKLIAGDQVGAATQLQGLDRDPQLDTSTRSFIRVIQAIVAGSRDRSLADTPGLKYRMAAEILFLLETLEKLR
jgi:tetratricopeptide (TPR) repeat protein